MLHWDLLLFFWNVTVIPYDMAADDLVTVVAINSLAPGVYEWNFRWLIFKQFFCDWHVQSETMNYFEFECDNFGTFFSFSFFISKLCIMSLNMQSFLYFSMYSRSPWKRLLLLLSLLSLSLLSWMPLSPTDDESTLIQVMIQCWPRYIHVSPYGVISMIRPQWVKVFWLEKCFGCSSKQFNVQMINAIQVFSRLHIFVAFAAKDLHAHLPPTYIPRLLHSLNGFSLNPLYI